MKIQRFKPVANAAIQPSENGEYVKYDDYVRLDKSAGMLGDLLKIIEALVNILINQHKEFDAKRENLIEKLAEESSALKSALSDILQPEAAILEREHRVRAMDALETPNTDDVVEIMKQDKQDGK
ncbi:TPA: hypothetical protein H2R31_002959 [Salmonella enterica]|nr:hypothetical protein [Salmonella enterica]